jgi:Mrp family chromosome partitioning ATPase
MQPREQAARSTLVLRAREVVTPTEEEALVRVVPVWASPPDLHVLAMLGESGQYVPAALRVIRHRLEGLRAEGLWTFAVTSARDGDGKSTLAAQLALCLSEAQRARVLLVEANLTRPSIGKVLGFRVPPGLAFSYQLAERMRGGIEPWAVLALGPSLHILAENHAEPGHPEALHSPHFKAAIERLGRAYDWVVVDAPSVLGSGDANVVEEAVDGVILAVRSRASKGADVRAAVKQLGSKKAVGVVLWDS